MALLRHALPASLALLVVLAACTAPGAPNGARDPSANSRPAAIPKRLVAAIRGDPPTVYTKVLVNPGGIQGLDEIEMLVHAGLAIEDNQGTIRPLLAEAVPTIENGQWRLLADGRMETTWQVRERAAWHDGARLTAADVAFTGALVLDPDMPTFSTAYYRALESVQAVDDRTLLIAWKRPFIRADQIFSSPLALPVPRHLLEEAYQRNKAGFTELPFWTSEFVGAGPFRLREFLPGDKMILDANPMYVLGQPRIDTIEVRFITASNTVAANILAGEIEATLGRTISLDQALQVRDRWPNGRMEVVLGTLYRINPQLLNPTPRVIGNVQFRRALVHAMDRQQMVDTLQAGLVGVGDSFLPDLPEFQAVNAGVTRYPHDPRRAIEMIEGLGYVRGPDGIFRDAASARLSVEIRTTAGDDTREKTLFSVADFWQRAGVGVDQMLVPIQRNTDREYRANRPGFVLSGGSSYLEGLEDLHGSQSPLPETSYVGRNDSRYMNPEFDALLDTYVATIPRQERLRVVARIVEHIADQLNTMTLFPLAEPMMVGNRLVNVVGRGPTSAVQVWNVHEWDLR